MRMGPGTSARQEPSCMNPQPSGAASASARDRDHVHAVTHRHEHNDGPCPATNEKSWPQPYSGLDWEFVLSGNVPGTVRAYRWLRGSGPASTGACTEGAGGHRTPAPRDVADACVGTGRRGAGA